jgi:putative oxidoreductase
VTTLVHRLSGFAPLILSVLRIVTGLIFLLHGSQKLFGFPPAQTMPALFTLYWYGGVIELAAGALVMVGLFTRGAAFIASGEMAFAYFMSHAPKALYPTLNGGDAAILYCFVFFYLVFAGAGPLSLDHMRRKR